MLYLTKDAGTAIGEIISAVAGTCTVSNVEIRLTQDALTTNFGTVERKTNKKGSSKIIAHSGPGKTSLIECDGISMDVKGWAKKLHLSETGIMYRMKRHGNPYGRKGPTNTDKIISGT